MNLYTAAPRQPPNCFSTKRAGPEAAWGLQPARPGSDVTMNTINYRNLISHRPPSDLRRTGKHWLAYVIVLVRADGLWWLISAVLLAIAFASHIGIAPAHGAQAPTTLSVLDISERTL